MKIQIINEEGFEISLFGLGLSYGLTSNISFSHNTFTYTSDDIDKKKLLIKLHNISIKLCQKDTGENKFLESIIVWIDIDAPLFWWSQFDTYRIGITKQSESKMHTIKKRPLVEDDFEYLEWDAKVKLDMLNELISFTDDISVIQSLIPSGFLQRRIVCTNYKTIRNIIQQRKSHKLKQWKYFVDEMYKQLEHKEYLP